MEFYRENEHGVPDLAEGVLEVMSSVVIIGVRFVDLREGTICPYL